jgi:hypothetical protein
MNSSSAAERVLMDPIMPNIGLEMEYEDKDIQDAFMLGVTIGESHNMTPGCESNIDSPVSRTVSTPMRNVCDESAVYQRAYQPYSSDSSLFPLESPGTPVLSGCATVPVRVTVPSPVNEDEDANVKRTNLMFAKKFDELKQIVEKFGCVTRNRIESIDAARSIIIHLEGTVLMFRKTLENNNKRSERTIEDVKTEVLSLSPLYEYNDSYTNSLDEFTPQR